MLMYEWLIQLSDISIAQVKVSLGPSHSNSLVSPGRRPPSSPSTVYLKDILLIVGKLAIPLRSLFPQSHRHIPLTTRTGQDLVWILDSTACTPARIWPGLSIKMLPFPSLFSYFSSLPICTSKAVPLPKLNGNYIRRQQRHSQLPMQK